ncbi:hypothetical protein CTZ27_11945 [Streptomyces griseocarneus]|nr:hypothetical protein CTZ27_11945 [Streptomyces griseocarneus]
MTAWRDHDPELCRVPGMALGSLDVPAGPVTRAARSLYEAGARRVALTRPVRLTHDPGRTDGPGGTTGPGGPDASDSEWAVQALSLVGALTGLAVVVDWQVHTDAAPDAWTVLNHLHPPTALYGPPQAEEALRAWRDGHYLCKCVYRQGPGFVQVRDRRRGTLRRFTISDPAYHEAIGALTDGAPASEVPEAVLADLLEEDLAVAVGQHVWWAPYQVQRWPLASLVI